MRVFMLTLGTQGDFELFRILGRELRGRGHRVVLGTSECYAARTREAGLEWERVGAGTWEELHAVLQSLAPVADRKMRGLLFAQHWLRPQVLPFLDRIQALAEGADFFVSNLKMILSRAGAVIPSAFVTYDPPLALEDLKPIDPRHHPGNVVDVVAMNQKLVDPQGLWGGQYRFTGFWKDDQPPPWEPSAEFRTVLEDGPPPVVLTMGSMVTYDAEALVRTVSQSLRLTGRAGIVVGAWSGISGLDSSTGPVYGIKEVPYDWLFPKAACVIHHGGCGTAAAVLRAGIPSILLPQVTSQEYFGWLLGRAGLVTGMFDTDILEPEPLAEAIRAAVTDPQFRQNAANWRDEIARDRGVPEAADLIEAHGRKAGG